VDKIHVPKVETLSALSDDVSSLHGLSERANRLKRLDKAIGAVSFVKDIEIPTQDRLDKIRENGIASLVSLADRIEVNHRKIKKLEGLNALKVPVVDSGFFDKCQIDISGALELKLRLQKAEASFVNAKKQAVEATEVYITSKQEVQDLLGGLGECPSCGAPVENCSK
jgi:hypothetical protein